MRTARILRFVLLLSVVALLGSGCIFKDDGAQKSVEALVGQFSASNYGGAWDGLHPSQQAVIPREHFIECGRAADTMGNPKVDRIEVTDATEHRMEVPGVGERKVTRVSVNLIQGENVSPRSWDVLKVDGKWRWFVAADTLAKYQAGECP